MSHQENLSLVIRHKIKDNSTSRYEAWLKRIMPMAATYPGHQGTHVARPTKGNNEYVIVVRFADITSAQTWIESPERRALIDEIADDLQTGDSTELKTGIDFWFTPVDEKKPKTWKQWLVTTSIIAPLTMIVPPALGPLFKVAPILATYGIAQFIVAGTIVALVTYLIMPRVVRLLHGWLYRQ